MAATYQITDESTHSKIVQSEGASILSVWILAKPTTAFKVQDGKLNIVANGETINIPRAFITVPSSSDDEDLANQISFLSANSSGGGAAVPIDTKYEVLPITSNGQTVFALATSISIVADKVKAFVNGQKIQHGTDYTVSGTVFTFINATFSLATTDLLEVYYG